ncbi:MAG: hypothetical protein ACJ741_15575 [Pyrinomonadaceae bacterium]
MAHFIDIILTLIAFVVPAYLVVRFNLIGVLVGALIFWLTLIIAGEVLSALDPERGRLLDAVWLRAGYLASLIYCALIYGAKQLYSFWRAKSRRAI